MHNTVKGLHTPRPNQCKAPNRASCPQVFHSSNNHLLGYFADDGFLWSYSVADRQLHTGYHV